MADPVPPAGARHLDWGIVYELLFAAGMDWEGKDPSAHVTLADVADTYLYLGPRASLTVSHPNPAIYRGDPEYVAELQRRRAILFGRPLDLDALYADKPIEYQRLSQRETTA